MILQRENAAAVRDPSVKKLEQELRRLRSNGPSSFAHLTDAKGNYLQAAGGGGGLLLERCDASAERHYRGYQVKPVVPFEDGTTLTFSAGVVQLKADEWFTLAQVIDVFCAYVASGTCPRYVLWRDITDVLGLP
jgi:hypothetical protein